IEIGKGTVSDVNDDVITLEVVSTKQQVRNGDRLMETGEGDLRGRFIPKAPGQKIYGQIMSVDDGVSYIGQYDVVALNRGIRDGIEPGHVMLVKSAGAVVYDREAKEKVRLPSEEAGSMMVFRVFDKLSYALIMRAQRPLKVGDYFESPDI
ncbi:MAG: peptidoglycan-binding protein, partial [Oleibacter sp.]|nr:peptidoglycan-binding protein [Thalassolituus sp.]